jgi:hypothetical protein
MGTAYWGWQACFDTGMADRLITSRCAGVIVLSFAKHARFAGSLANEVDAMRLGSFPAIRIIHFMLHVTNLLESVYARAR